MNYIPINEDGPDYNYVVQYDFDEYCRGYYNTSESRPMGNVEFLLGMQELAQKKLDASPSGCLYLCEVLKDCTIKPDKQSRILGWNRYAGTGVVDFGLNPELATCESDRVDLQLFLNGVEPGVTLTFNVDGPLVGSFRPMVLPY